MKRIWAVVLLGAAILLGYVLVRQIAISRLDNELHTLRDKVASQQSLQRELGKQSHLLAGEADIASFVESLYACASRTGILDHEVTTSQRQDPAQARRVRRSPGPTASAELKASRLQVALRGDFRSIAEYLRQVDEIARPKQIFRLEMTAEGPSIRMLLLIDLYSLKRPAAYVH